MTLSRSTLVSLLSVVVITLCLLPGTARASMFSPEATPFPLEGVYRPTNAEGPAIYYNPFGYPTFEEETLFIGLFDATQYVWIGQAAMVTEPTLDEFDEVVPGEFEFALQFFGTDFSGFDSDLNQPDPAIGHLSIAPDGDGFQITSSFDIFFELSNETLFPGQSFSGNYHYELQSLEAAVPEPGTLVLFGTGLLVVARGYRLRMARRTAAGSTELSAAC